MEPQITFWQALAIGGGVALLVGGILWLMKWNYERSLSPGQAVKDLPAAPTDESAPSFDRSRLLDRLKLALAIVRTGDLPASVMSNAADDSSNPRQLSPAKSKVESEKSGEKPVTDSTELKPLTKRQERTLVEVLFDDKDATKTRLVAMMDGDDGINLQRVNTFLEKTERLRAVHKGAIPIDTAADRQREVAATR